MAAKALTLDEAKQANFAVVEDDGRGNQAVHDVVVAMHANRRSGTANSKTRGEVNITGKKPWRQKGTGRARAGGNASPIWEGGGVVFGPRPRDYSKKVNKGTRRLAFAKALSERIKEGDVLVVDSFSITDGKTRSFAKEISGLTDAKKVIVVGNKFDETTKRAARNYASALLMSAAELNTEHVLYFGKIVVVKDALATLAGRTGAN
ncbi:MAG: 50S ribosomal protein L4 [Verrucomicrobiales bacterium]|nr:50S ribosomal protein L4 [Verrucomicrobiales bacterium]